MIAPKIMVVEDEEPLGVLLRYNLEAEGYQVEVIPRGDEAEIRLQENVPDLLVLDWMVPSVSGIELCRRLRASGVFDHTDLKTAVRKDHMFTFQLEAHYIRTLGPLSAPQTFGSGSGQVLRRTAHGAANGPNSKPEAAAKEL